MGINEHTPSDAALRALHSILPGGAFDTDAPSFILHDVLAYLKEMEHLTEDECALKIELESTTAEERERLGRGLAAARRKE
jgi:hypothetical protein